MPIEITELTIRAVVDQNRPNTSGGLQAGGNRGSQLSASDRNAIVQEAVEKVLEVLRNKEER